MQTDSPICTDLPASLKPLFAHDFLDSLSTAAVPDPSLHLWPTLSALSSDPVLDSVHPPCPAPAPVAAPPPAPHCYNTNLNSQVQAHIQPPPSLPPLSSSSSSSSVGLFSSPTPPSPPSHAVSVPAAQPVTPNTRATTTPGVAATTTTATATANTANIGHYDNNNNNNNNSHNIATANNIQGNAALSMMTPTQLSTLRTLFDTTGSSFSSPTATTTTTTTTTASFPTSPVTPSKHSNASSKPTAEEDKLIRLIHRKVGGAAKLSTYEEPSCVRRIVIDALAAEQRSVVEAARVRRGQLSASERRVVRTVTNRGAAVRSRMRQRREMATLKMQVRAREGRVRQLENVVRALCSAYKVPLPPAAATVAGECHKGATAAGTAAVQTGTDKNRNGAGMGEQEGEREDELVKNLFRGPEGGDLEAQDMVVDDEVLDMEAPGDRPRPEMWVHQ